MERTRQIIQIYRNKAAELARTVRRGGVPEGYTQAKVNEAVRNGIRTYLNRQLGDHWQG